MLFSKRHSRNGHVNLYTTLELGDLGGVQLNILKQNSESIPTENFKTKWYK